MRLKKVMASLRYVGKAMSPFRCVWFEFGVSWRWAALLAFAVEGYVGQRDGLNECRLRRVAMRLVQGLLFKPSRWLHDGRATGPL